MDYDESAWETCDHEWEPMSHDLIVVTEEQARANPLKFDWAPEPIVPCRKCGAPINRGRFTGLVRHPYAGLGVPLDEDSLLRSEERVYIEKQGRCEVPNCRHLNALHDPESGLCMLDGCRCALDDRP